MEYIYPEIINFKYRSKVGEIESKQLIKIAESIGKTIGGF